MITISVVKRNLVDVECDILVNAANQDLKDGRGVDEAVTRAGLLSSLKKTAKQLYCNIRNQNSKRSTSRCIRVDCGDSVFTDRGQLPNVKIGVAHAVGPIWSAKVDDCRKKLMNAYISSLQIAKEKGAKSICFPFLSTGVFKCPKAIGIKTALEAVVFFLINVAKIENIIFATLDDTFVSEFISLVGSSKIVIGKNDDVNAILNGIISNSNLRTPGLSAKKSSQKIAIKPNISNEETRQAKRVLFQQRKDNNTQSLRNRYHAEVEVQSKKIAEGKNRYAASQQVLGKFARVRYHKNREERLSYGIKRYSRISTQLRAYQRKYSKRKRALMITPQLVRVKRSKISESSSRQEGEYLENPIEKATAVRDAEYFRKIRYLRRLIANEVKYRERKRASPITVFKRHLQRFHSINTAYYQKRVRAVFKILNYSVVKSYPLLQEKVTIVMQRIQYVDFKDDPKKVAGIVKRVFDEVESLFKLRNAVSDGLGNVLARFLRTFCTETPRKPEETDEEYAKRQICGVKYHVRSHDPPEVQCKGGYKPLGLIYAQAFGKFNARDTETILFLDDFDELEGNDSSVEEDTPVATTSPLLNVKNSETLAKLCSSSCREPHGWIQLLTSKMKRFENCVGEDLATALEYFVFCEQCSLQKVHCESECENALRVLKKVAPCYNGVRSVLRRFYDVRRCVGWLVEFDQAISTASADELRSLSESRNVPVHQRLILPPSKGKRDQLEHHKQENVEDKFRKVIEKFEKALREDQSDNVCYCCFERRKRRDIVRMGKITDELKRDLQYMMFSEDIDQLKDVQLCRQCYRDFKKKVLPSFSSRNNFHEMDKQPEELKDLTLIEKTVISMYRCNQAIVKLTTQSGYRGHLHSGSKGTAIIVPNNPEGSVKRVLQHLPALDDLTIIVETTTKVGKVSKYLVRMDKVIGALKWYKKNNKFYKDVTIVEDLHFTNKSLTTVTTVDAGECGENYCLTPKMDFVGLSDMNMLPTDEVQKLFALKKSDATPTNQTTDKCLDMMAFPDLFPYGSGGMFDDRPRRVQPAMFLRHQMKSIDRKYAQNHRYLFERACFKDRRSVESKLRIHMKKRISGKTLLQKINDGDPGATDLLYPGFSSIPSSPQYWQQLKSELRSAIHQFGPPTFFLTLNPAEANWNDLLQFMKKLNIDNTEATIHELCAKDPALFTEYFHTRVDAFFRDVLLSKEAPLGEIVHHVRRYEYQKRGAPHCHSLLWIKDAPQIGVSTEEEIVKFINKHITCRRPDPENEPKLSYIVETMQTHREPCTGTCRRSYLDRRTRRKVDFCRFGFPRPTSIKTTINDSSEGESGPQRGRLYSLQRMEDETRINDYNPLVSLLWQANHDLQFVSSASEAIINYVLGYASKPENKSVVKDIVDTTTATRLTSVFSLTNQLLRKGEKSACEAADQLLGLKNFVRSHDVRWINLGKSKERIRVAKPLSELKDDEETSTTMANLMDDYYRLRPTELENCSLANFVINCETTRSKAQVATDDDAVDEHSENADNAGINSHGKTCGSYPAYWHPDDEESPFYHHPGGRRFNMTDGKGVVRLRYKPCLFRCYLPDPEASPEKQEDFCRRILLLFRPWRQELNLPCENTWSAELEKWLKDSSEVVRETVNLYIEKQKSWYLSMKIASEEWQSKRKDAEQFVALTDEDDAFMVPERLVDLDEHEEERELLNTTQKEIFSDVMDHVYAQNLGEVLDSLLLFVTGCAGTGKSHLLKCIADELVLCYTKEGREKKEPAVIIGAPTGLAAKNIGGSTLHSLFNFKVQIGSEQLYEPLTAEKLHELRMLFRNCQLLIVDEVSMVSNVLLTQMHARLQEIKGNSLPFGGVNILLTGDLLQLSPVMAGAVYQELSADLVNKTFGSVGVAINLWKHFTYNELQENMRQRADLSYAEIMQRLRVGTTTTADLDALKTRFIPSSSSTSIPTDEEIVSHYLIIRDHDEKALALFPTNREVDSFNNTVAAHLNKEDLVEILAFDTDPISLHRDGALERPYAKRETRRYRTKHLVFKPVEESNDDAVPTESSNRTAGLASKLTVGVGSRIMLRRNVDVPNGLVNGALGVIVDIHMKGAEVDYLSVLFDHLKEPVPIERVVASFKKGRNTSYAVKRKQFPVALAYGVTIHKSQGMSLSNILVDLRGIFEFGQGYVALSRARSLDGVHIIGLSRKGFGCIEEGVLEYNRLRTLAGIPPYSVWNTAIHLQHPLLQGPISGRKKQPAKKAVAPAEPHSEKSPPSTRGRVQHQSVHQKNKESVRDSHLSTTARSRSVSRKLRQKVSFKDVANVARPQLVNDWPHKFANPANPTQTMCFMNATMQCLFALPAFTSIITQGRGTTREHQEVIRIYNDTNLQVLDTLRARFDTLNDEEQHDADEFLNCLLPFLPPAVLSMFEVTHHIEVNCRRCESEPKIDRFVFYTNFLTPNSRNTIPLDRGIDKCVAKHASCNHCDATHILEDVVVDARPDHKILVLVAPLFDQYTAERRKLSFRGDVNTPLHINDHRYRVMAVVMHVGRTMGSGHYFARVRHEDGWITANDDTVTFDKQFSMDDVYLLFYEKEE